MHVTKLSTARLGCKHEFTDRHVYNRRNRDRKNYSSNERSSRNKELPSPLKMPNFPESHRPWLVTVPLFLPLCLSRTFTVK